MITRKKIAAFVAGLTLLAAVTVANLADTVIPVDAGQAIACTEQSCSCGGGGC